MKQIGDMWDACRRCSGGAVFLLCDIPEVTLGLRVTATSLHKPETTNMQLFLDFSMRRDFAGTSGYLTQIVRPLSETVDTPDISSISDQRKETSLVPFGTLLTQERFRGDAVETQQGHNAEDREDLRRTCPQWDTQFMG